MVAAPRRLTGADLAHPPTKRPIGFRPLQQRRSCGRWNWRPHRLRPEEFRQSPSPGPSPLRRKLRGCNFLRFRPGPTNWCQMLSFLPVRQTRFRPGILSVFTAGESLPLPESRLTRERRPSDAWRLCVQTCQPPLHRARYERL